MSVESLIAHYGLAALFAGAAFEGEAAVVAGGLLVHQGLMSLPGAMIAAAAGSFAADQMWFAIGRRFREARLVARLRGTAAYAKATAALERHPRTFIFAFRFLYGLRTVSPIVIGTTAVRQPLYTAINAVAAAVWSVVFVTIGYVFGEAFEDAVGRLRHDSRLWVIVALLVAGGVAVGIVHWLRGRRHR